MKNAYTVIIIGSGFGGQCAAINLQKNNINDFCILERRDFMGGTWMQNNYPGAAVDVQSPLYSFSFEPYNWSQMFAERDELEAYTKHIIKKYDLEKETKINTNVEKLEWSNDLQKWKIHTNNGEYLAQFIINASGPLSTPVIPNFKGKDSFKGKSFHSNNWDNNYDYSKKRVAVIGSGASAAQIIPAIAPDVKHLAVFQRTPHWVLPRPDKNFNNIEKFFLGNNNIYNIVRNLIYWQLETRVIGFKYSDFMLKKVAEDVARKYIKASIKDKTLQEKVTPDYTIGCKRIILSSTLYPAFTRDNVTLFSKENGIKEIVEDGIITQDGTKVELDLIVYATGYDATDNVISYPVYGKDGTTIADFWHDFPRAYLGTALPNFPNLFVVTGPNTGIGHTSAIFIIEAQMNYIMKSIQTVIASNKTIIEVKEEAEEKYTNMIHDEMKKTVWQSGGCNSWYKSKSGKVIAMFPGFSFTYLNMTKNFKTKDHILS
ncbi:MAG: NAD(P)/FAD-dependent oxidoreductase [Chitinophagales bacterium]|nr:NAD(P)/FAD-dependent oxidoreductase [Chitinophagales bacterium]